PVHECRDVLARDSHVGEEIIVERPQLADILAEPLPLADAVDDRAEHDVSPSRMQSAAVPGPWIRPDMSCRTARLAIDNAALAAACHACILAHPALEPLRIRRQQVLQE